jgi:hypothetical protein
MDMGQSSYHLIGLQRIFGNGNVDWGEAKHDGGDSTKPGVITTDGSRFYQKRSSFQS